MDGILAKAFIVQLFTPPGASSRAVRRVIVNADILKSVRVSAGDVLAISKIGDSHSSKVQVRAPIPLPYPIRLNQAQMTPFFESALLADCRISIGVRDRNRVALT